MKSHAWEQRKLNEIADVYDGVHQTPKYTSSGVRFLSVENIGTLESEKYISEADFLRDFEGEENFVGDSEIIALGGASNETKDRPLG